MKIFVHFFIGIIALSLVSCSDIFETTIDDQKINIVAPADSLETSNYSPIFWWDEMQDAKQYRVQIGSPDFDNISKLYLDTTLKTTKFVYTLNPGKYQWRIRGENGTSYTKYSVRSLTIIQSSLKNQTLHLTAPVTGYSTTSSTVKFKWEAIYGADKYRLQVDTITGNFSGTLKLDQEVSYNNFYDYTFPRKGSYVWRVKGMNSADPTDETPYSDRWTVIKSN